MKKIKLHDIQERRNSADEYTLDPTEKYVINLEEEMEFQMAVMMSFQMMGPPPAIKNYHAWLFENGFNVELPNPTNEVVAPYYGVKPLWKTDYSQGIVVMAEDESDYYIVMECSSRNKGYKRTKVILTKYSSDRDTLRVECKSAVFHADFLLLRLSRFGNSTGLDASS